MDQHPVLVGERSFLKELEFNTGDTSGIAQAVAAAKAAGLVDALEFPDEFDSRLEEITGGPQGFSGPVGLDGVRLVADQSVMELKVAATGANSKDTHLVGVVPSRDFDCKEVATLQLAQAGDGVDHHSLRVDPGSQASQDNRLGIEVLDQMGPLLPVQANALYRIAEEALANVARHSAADHVDLRLGDEGGVVTMSIADDGCGFDPRGEHAGMGLVSMRERAEALRAAQVDEEHHGHLALFDKLLDVGRPGPLPRR